MSDVVVTLSGVVSLGEMAGKTADQLIDLALAHWNVPRESVESPFVTIHDRSTNKLNPLQGDDSIGTLASDAVVRVVLPLRNTPVEVVGSKQYLVEG